MNQEELEQYINEMKSAIKIYYENIATLKKCIKNQQNVCDHNKTKIKETYNEHLGYDDYFSVKEQCQICEKITKKGRRDDEDSEIIWE